MANVEAQIQKSILTCLQGLGYWCWRNNSGNTIVGEGSSKRMIRMSPKGSPDIVGVLPGGRFWGIEVKAPGKKQNANQIEWEAKARKHGVRYAVARSVVESIALLSQWSGEVSSGKAAE
jgi:hypothetical protein